MSLAVKIRHWQDLGACRGASGVDFFSEEPAEIGRAKAVCATCPVKVECLEYAKDNGEEDGVWGGLTPHERGRGTFRSSHTCLSCGGVLVPFSEKRERCLSCECVWFAED